MNRFKCPACGGNQYTSADTAEGCIYCGHQKLEKMDNLEPEEVVKDEFFLRRWRGQDGSRIKILKSIRKNLAL